MGGYAVMDQLAHHARATPDKVALIELPSRRQQTYSGMHQRVGQLATWLRDMGIEKGDRVGFLGLNSIDILDIVFAVWRVGGVVLALNFRLTAKELGFIVGDAGPKVIFADGAFAKTVDALKIDTPEVCWVGFDGEGGDSEFERGIADAEPMLERIPQVLEDICMLMYSSGTTGRPKGVMITYGMLQFSAASGTGPGRSSRDGVSLAAMPLFHIAAMNVSCLPTLLIGATAVVMRMFAPGAVLEAIDNAELGVTHFFAVPAAFNAMRQHVKAETTDFSRLITVVSGAETVPPPLVDWWGERGICLQEGYGLTETAGQGCLLAHEDVAEHTGSAGKPLMQSDMKIMVDESTEAEVGETGEIWIRGGVVTPGYWNWPEATEKAFVGDWFRTGDIGRRDGDNFFYIEDRLKDMYISGGENVYPAEIEGVLYGMDAIREVSVIGVKHPTWGETGCAVVSLKDDQSLTLDEIIAFCENKLAKYKHPSHLEFIDALPRNATGKVLKFQLRERYAHLGKRTD
ncbi:MAG: acyl-CoA synthetase [Rhizobiaceae bacterium]